MQESSQRVHRDPQRAHRDAQRDHRTGCTHAREFTETTMEGSRTEIWMKPQRLGCTSAREFTESSQRSTEDPQRAHRDAQRDHRTGSTHAREFTESSQRARNKRILVRSHQPTMEGSRKEIWMKPQRLGCTSAREFTEQFGSFPLYSLTTHSSWSLSAKTRLSAQYF